MHFNLFVILILDIALVQCLYPLIYYYLCTNITSNHHQLPNSKI